MGRTTFSGPVRSINGFEGPVTPAPPDGGGAIGPGVIFTAVPSASLPAPTLALKGAVMCVFDNGVANNETCLVVCNGVAWTVCDGTPLS